MPAMSPMNAPAGTVEVRLGRHGQFYCSLTRLAQIDSMSKKTLAASIANHYESDKAPESYWMQYPKTVLLIVYGDLYPNKEALDAIWDKRMADGSAPDGLTAGHIG